MGFDGFFLSAEFIRRWEGEPPSEPNLSARCEVQFLRAQKIFSAVQEHCPPENLPLYHSPLAIRKSLPFRLGKSLALPFFSSLVPRPTTRFKSVSTKTKPSKAG